MNETEQEEVPILKRQPHTQSDRQKKQDRDSHLFAYPCLSLNYLLYLKNGNDLNLYF